MIRDLPLDHDIMNALTITEFFHVSTLFQNLEWIVWRRAVESSSCFTKVDGNFSAENSGNWCYVVGE